MSEFTYTGQEGAVYVGTDEVGEVRDFSVEQTSEVVADTVMGATWVTNKATLKSWTASVNMYWTGSDTGQVALAVGAEVTLNLYPRGNTSTYEELTGTAIVTSVSQSQSFDGMVELSISVTGNGPLTIGTV